jgi:hypothetical protein
MFKDVLRLVSQNMSCSWVGVEYLGMNLCTMVGCLISMFEILHLTNKNVSMAKLYE